jgi:hypothetical protein
MPVEAHIGLGGLAANFEMTPVAVRRGRSGQWTARSPARYHGSIAQRGTEQIGATCSRFSANGVAENFHAEQNWDSSFAWPRKPAGATAPVL